MTSVSSLGYAILKTHETYESLTQGGEHWKMVCVLHVVASAGLMLVCGAGAGTQKFSTVIGVWSLGCIMAGLLMK